MVKIVVSSIVMIGMREQINMTFLNYQGLEEG